MEQDKLLFINQVLEILSELGADQYMTLEVPVDDFRKIQPMLIVNCSLGTSYTKAEKYTYTYRGFNVKPVEHLEEWRITINL